MSRTAAWISASSSDTGVRRTMGSQAPNRFRIPTPIKPAANRTITIVVTVVGSMGGPSVRQSVAHLSGGLESEARVQGVLRQQLGRGGLRGVGHPVGEDVLRLARLAGRGG